MSYYSNSYHAYYLYSESVNLLSAVQAVLLVAHFHFLSIALAFSLSFHSHNPDSVLDRKFPYLFLAAAFVALHMTFAALHMTFAAFQSTVRPQSFVSSLRVLRTINL